METIEKLSCDRDILCLSEELAQELIYRLCVAECARLGLSTAYVETVGNSRNKDDLYVRVNLPAYSKVSGFIPHPQTLICVKTCYVALHGVAQQFTQPADLEPFDESRGAAYVLASTKQALTNPRVADYQSQMQKVIANEANSDLCAQLDLYFYSRQKLVAWLNSHAEVKTWLERRYQTLTESHRSECTKLGGSVIFYNTFKACPKRC